MLAGYVHIKLGCCLTHMRDKHLWQCESLESHSFVSKSYTCLSGIPSVYKYMTKDKHIDKCHHPAKGIIERLCSWSFRVKFWNSSKSLNHCTLSCQEREKKPSCYWCKVLVKMKNLKQTNLHQKRIGCVCAVWEMLRTFPRGRLDRFMQGLQTD